MRITDVKLPASLQQWMAEYKATPYYISAVRTVEAELKERSSDYLHDRYESQLLSNVMGRVWMQLWSNPELAMSEILAMPADPVFGVITRRDFLCTLCQLEQLETLGGGRGITTPDNFPRKSLLDFVCKIDGLATDAWSGRTETLWNRLLDDEAFVTFVKGRSAKEVFSKNKVYLTVGHLISAKVYKDTFTQMQIGDLLEDGNVKEREKHRSQLSHRPDDRICRVIDDCIALM